MKLMRRKRIHREGVTVIVVTFFLAVLLNVCVNLFSPRQTFWHYFMYFITAMYCFWTVCFFRIPNRETRAVKNGVLSPADGEVVANEIVFDTEYFHAERRLVSIFMSIYNVHINWFPIDGIVSYRKYHPGKFLVAYKPKSSTENENNTVVVLDSEGREVMFRQIAGYVARRIICDLEEGEPAVAGEEFGMIRFGSRLDVFLPLDADVQVKIGDKVRGKQTVLGLMKSQG